MLGVVGLAREDLLHDGGRGRSGLGRPGHDALRRPLGVFPVGLGHVFRQGGVLARKKRTDMRSHPVPLVQAFDRGRGGTDIQLLAHQTMGNAVKMVVHLNVVIDMDPGFDPEGELVRGLGQRQHRRPVELFETAAPTAGEFAEGAVVQQFQPLPDGGVGLSQTEEGTMTKPGQDKALGDQHTPFDLGLVLGTANASGDDGGAVMVGTFGVAGIEVRLVAAGLGDPGAQVVRNHAMGNGAEIASVYPESHKLL